MLFNWMETIHTIDLHIVAINSTSVSVTVNRNFMDMIDHVHQFNITLVSLPT